MLCLTFFLLISLSGCEKAEPLPFLDEKEAEIKAVSYHSGEYPVKANLSEIDALPVYTVTDDSIDRSRQMAELTAGYFGIDIDSAGMEKAELYSVSPIYDPYFLYENCQKDTADYRLYEGSSFIRLRSTPVSVSFQSYDNVYDSLNMLKRFGFEHINSTGFSYDKEADAVILPPDELAQFEKMSEEYIAENSDMFPGEYRLYYSNAYVDPGAHPLIHDDIQYRVNLYYSVNEPSSAAEKLLYYSDLTPKLCFHYIVYSDNSREAQTVVYYPCDNLTEVGTYDIIPYDEAGKRFELGTDVHLFYGEAQSTDEERGIFLVYVIDTSGVLRPVWICQNVDSHTLEGAEWIDAICCEKND